MSRRLKAVRVEMSILAHSTEDFKKVKHALQQVLPERIRGVQEITVENLEGHYGNPIKLVKVVLSKHEWATALIEHIASSLPEEDLRHIIENLNSYLDKEGTLYLRLDKQAAYLGNFRLRQDDAIRVKVKFIGYGLDRASLKEGLRCLLIQA